MSSSAPRKPVSPASRSDMLPSGPAGHWRGVLLEVQTDDVPGLRVEAAPPQHLRVTQVGEPVLWAVVARDRRYVAWRRSGSWRSVVSPISAADERRIAQREGAAWWQSWTHWFIDQLEA